ARARSASADLLLWVVDASDPARVQLLPETGKNRPAPPAWLIHNKIDLVQRDRRRNEQQPQTIGKNESDLQTNKLLTNIVKKSLTEKSECKFIKSELEFYISAVSGEGFDQLLVELTRYAKGFLAGSESALVTRERHRRALEDTVATLRRALVRDLAGREDLLAEELRIAARSLGRLTGRVDVEDILDVIFRDFCIGK
ncbi:MAG TPA: hypothetical protein VLN44_01660, partial [Pyrinomonadaceae bacterium]|nr:hypothetical protein [Pyrinomonadaceae bacterium]